MQSRTGKSILAAVLSGCMIASCMPLTSMAAETFPEDGSLAAVFSETAAGHESMLTLTADADFNGEKEVVIHDYMPRQEYVKDGLVLWLDGLDNAGAGVHDSQAEYWMDLTDQTPIAINRDDRTDTEGMNHFTDNAFCLNASKVYLPDKVAQAVNGDAYTVEFVVDSEGYSGYERGYSPLMTVDETADSWSIFVRTAGQTMELKQGANSLRLRTDFANVFDTTSAITFRKNGESAWYADAEKKNTFVSGNNAAAQQVILGGRLKDNSGNVSNAYVTTASWHAIRVYNRALSEEELQQNAAYDRARYYGEEMTAPEVKLNGTALSEEGTTTVTARFENGVAVIPVESTQTGSVPMKITVDGRTCETVLVTNDVVDLAVRDIPDSVHLTGVSETAAVSVIRAMLKEQVEAALADTFFAEDGGSVSVSGTESPYRVDLTLGDQTKTKSVAVTIEYADSTDMDILKRAMAKIMQGEFSFETAEEVTAEALQQQITEKLDSGITASVVWDDGKQCYELTLLKGEENLTSPLYVNSEVSISDFTEEFLQYCTMRKTGTTSIEAKDGAVCVKATESRTYENIVLPIFSYGRDYMISVDLKMTDSTDNARWAALSYGVTANPSAGDQAFTFWQMAVRRNATAGNGVECANRTASDTWSVPSTGSYTENLDPDTTYHLKVVIKGKKVYEYINDRLMVRYETQEQMKHGKLAFTFDRVTAEFSNLVMTSEIPDDLMTEFPKTENGYDADIYEPTTGLVMAPAVVSEEDEKSVAQLVSGRRRPSTIIRTVSDQLTVMDEGEEISITDYMARADKKALVGFRVESMDTAEAFAAFVKENNLVDIMVLSDDEDILLTACGRMPGVHGMLDFSGYEDDAEADLSDYVCRTNRANSRIMVLPEELATEENIEYIQARAVSVWVRTDPEHLTDVILNGADGILTDDFESAYDVIESFDEDTEVLTRNTIITAHRGLHLTAPENSERAAKLAVEAGADALECDVHLTKDGQVVVNHDETTGRLMNQNLTVADSTLEELQALTFNANAQEGDKIPTLQELFLAADEADPDDDIVHVIEIKTGDTNVIEPMVKIIRDMHMEDRVVFISFHDYQLELVRQVMPEVAVGELNSVCSAADDVAAAMQKLCDRMDAYGYFYNCNYGAQNADITQAARFRGIYVHPWTVDALEVFENEFIGNYHGITTNRADYAKDYLNKVLTGKDHYTLTAGSKSGVVIDASAYTRGKTKIEGVNLTMKQLSGTPVTYDPVSGTCHAQEEGEATVLIGAVYQLPGTGKTYSVYSKPVTLEIKAAETPAPVKASLKMLYDTWAGEDLSVYTKESAEALENALAEAEIVLNNADASRNELDQAVSDLVTAIGGLEYGVQKLHLEVTIEAAEKILTLGKNYEEIEGLTAAVEAGKIVFADEMASQETVDGAAYAVLDELFKLAKTADISSLESLIEAAKALFNGKYTSDSLENLRNAIDAAEAVVADQNRDDSDISDAYANLIDAIIKLQMKGNKAALKAMLIKANEVLADAKAYVAESTEGLAEVTEAAKEVYDNEDALQSEVNEAVKTLTLKVAEARLLGDVDGDGDVTTADSAAVLRSAAEIDTLSAEAASSADVNGDGKADTSDAVMILQYAAEKIAVF